jgi:hypothetical protein
MGDIVQKPTALQSARTLRALNPTRLAVGHGKVLLMTPWPRWTRQSVLPGGVWKQANTISFTDQLRDAR